jgi:hypothetical protein
MAAKPRYGVELKASEIYGAFQVGDEAVELDADKRVWETTDYALYRQIRDALPPFLKDLGEIKPGAKKEGAE